MIISSKILILNDVMIQEKMGEETSTKIAGMLLRE